MPRTNACGICLLLTLWICYPTPATSGQLLTEQEIDSMIPSDRFYSGSEVRDLVKGLVAEAHKEIRQAAAEAVKEAMIPIMADKAAAEVRAEKWEAAWREELAGRVWGKVLLFTGSSLLLFTGGAALGAAAF